MEVMGKKITTQMMNSTSYVSQQRTIDQHPQQANQTIVEDISQSKDKVKSMVDGLNDILDPLDKGFKFEFHEDLERYYVTVVNKQTNEVIKEIPPKKLLDAHALMIDFMGLLVDEKI